MNDDTMMKKVEELWYGGHAEELRYFGSKCAEAAIQGCNDGGKAGLIIGLCVGIVGSTTLIIVKNIRNHRSKFKAES